MEYDFLKDVNLVGQRFYHPQEYRLNGIIYNIIRMSQKTMDIEWVDPHDEDGKNYKCTSTLYIDKFIKQLNKEFYVLMPDDDDYYDSIIDNIKW